MTVSTQQKTAALEREAKQALQAGDPHRAEALLRQALVLNSGAPDIVSNLGVVLGAQNRFEEALECHRRALARAPRNPNFHSALGSTLLQAGQPQQALAAFDRVLGIDPKNLEALFRKGNALRTLGRKEAAAEAYRAVLAEAPDSLAVLINLGGLLSESDQLEEAAKCLRRALALKPDSIPAQTNLGMVLRQQGRLKEAAALLQKAAAAHPGNASIHLQLGQTFIVGKQWDPARRAIETALALQPSLADAYIALGEVWRAERCWPEASDAYLAAIRLKPSAAELRLHFKLGLQCLEEGAFEAAAEAMLAPVRLERSPNNIPASSAALETSRLKLVHDLEQLRYLKQEGILGSSFDGAIKAYEKALSELSVGNDNRLPSISAQRFPQVVTNANRLIHVENARALPGGALNEELDGEAIAAAYRERPLGATYVDDLLKPEALARLRDFCNKSTVWWQLEHSSELGSIMHRGFACPLLAQIAHDLRQALPELLGSHRFTSLWAYKYFPTAHEILTHGRSSGLDVHADDGAVTVNFWIAPDEGNLEPNSGGLRLWDREAPPEYFETGSREERLKIIDALMQDAGQPSLIVPHRANRAVIFHSNSLHRSDSFQFDDAYLKRKISITVMFGHRSNQ